MKRSGIQDCLSTPVQHPGAIHEHASALRPSIQHAVRQALPAPASHVHDTLCLAPVEGVLQADFSTPQAELGEVGHGLLEVVSKGLVALLLIILHAIQKKPRFRQVHRDSCATPACKGAHSSGMRVSVSDQSYTVPETWIDIEETTTGGVTSSQQSCMTGSTFSSTIKHDSCCIRQWRVWHAQTGTWCMSRPP